MSNPRRKMNNVSDKSAKNISVKAQNVTVNPSVKRNRNRRRRNRNINLTQTAPAGGGPITNDGKNVIRTQASKAISQQMLKIDPSSLSWYFKYLDPAGATESGRAIGEFSKIPDGLCKFSVDAEMRSIYNEECPTIGTGGIPLDGANWSVTIFSPPMFRFNYLVVADTRDREITRDMLLIVLEQVNNLSDWKAVADESLWNSTTDPNVWWRIRTNPPLADMPEPVVGSTTTVSDYRLTYKGMTLESNAPTLVDQGYWIGGQYAITPKETPAEVPSINEPVTRTGVIHLNVGTSNVFVTLDIVDLTVSAPAPWVVVQSPILMNTDFTHPLSDIITPTVTVQLPSTKMLRLAGTNAVWADALDTITFTVGPPAETGHRTFTFTSSRSGTTPVAISHLSGAWTTTVLYLEANDYSGSSTYNVLELPPSEINQIAANNPKIEQFLMKESMGAYIVHSKMRNPVFQLSSAAEFGWVKFKTNTSSFSYHEGGIRDTIDKNFSSAVVSVRGISQSQTIVVKTYVGWEGITLANTPYGQFAHTGLLECEEILRASNQLATSLTGVYPANDNFAAIVSAFAAKALMGLMRGEASSSVITGIAQEAVSSGASAINTNLPGLISGIVGVGQRLVSRIRARRNR